MVMMVRVFITGSDVLGHIESKQSAYKRLRPCGSQPDDVLPTSGFNSWDLGQCDRKRLGG